jgi:hypothetical protein
MLWVSDILIEGRREQNISQLRTPLLQSLRSLHICAVTLRGYTGLLFISFLVWPTFPTRCRCRKVLLPLSALRDRNHTRWDSSGRVISPSHRPLPDNTQHSQQTDIHAQGEIGTHDPRPTPWVFVDARRGPRICLNFVPYAAVSVKSAVTRRLSRQQGFSLRLWQGTVSGMCSETVKWGFVKHND